MSYSQLPTELKQRIVLYVHLADKAFRTRTNHFKNASSLKTLNEQLKARWGKSLVALSAVNREFRSMSVVHLFSTINMKGVSKPLFLEWILDSPLSANFTTFEFENAAEHTLRFTLMHVLPRLPRIKKISGLKREVTWGLFGVGGMAAVEKLALGPSPENDARIYAWRKFKTVALKVKYWELELGAEEVEALFSIDPSIKSNAVSVSLSTPKDDYGIMGANDGRYPTLLGQLPCLTSLSFSDRSPAAVPGHYWKPLSTFAISTVYQFTPVLTSFTWLGDSRTSTLDDDFFRFLTRFTSLQHLRLQAASISRDEESPEEEYTFEEITELDISSGTFDGIDHQIFQIASFPKLVNLTLAYRFPDKDQAQLQQGSAWDNLASSMYAFEKTLQNIYLYVDGNLYENLVDELRPVYGSRQSGYRRPKMHINWQKGLAEAEAPGLLNTSAPGNVGLGKEVLAEAMDEGIEELADWVEEERCRVRRSGDLAKAKELLLALTPVWELKKWYED